MHISIYITIYLSHSSYMFRCSVHHPNEGQLSCFCSLITTFEKYVVLSRNMSVSLEAFAATELNEIFSGRQERQFVKGSNSVHILRVC
jgi:hypothetical protein